LNVFTKTNVKSALAASVFHYNEINIKELKNYLESFAIPVRSFDMLEKIKFDKKGLDTVVVKDVTTKQVLMLDNMNKEAYIKYINKLESYAMKVKSYYNIEKKKFDKQGLVPVVVQDVTTKQVLMLAYMNKEAYLKTIETKETWFYSRSRGELWHKGATSGNKQ